MYLKLVLELMDLVERTPLRGATRDSVGHGREDVSSCSSCWNFMQNAVLMGFVAIFFSIQVIENKGW
jgi:hypothetical protein